MDHITGNSHWPNILWTKLHVMPYKGGRLLMEHHNHSAIIDTENSGKVDHSKVAASTTPRNCSFLWAIFFTSNSSYLFFVL